MFENFVTNYENESGELVAITMDNRNDVILAIAYSTQQLENIFKENQNIKVKK